MKNIISGLENYVSVASMLCNNVADGTVSYYLYIDYLSKEHWFVSEGTVELVC